MKLPEEVRKTYLKSKNLSYGLTFFTNTIFIASSIGILNRIATKKKYNDDNNLNKR